MEHLVQHAVATIHERFWEPLSLDDLARSAMVSKFHFLRMFSRVTGVTPGRFLSAVRLQEAKRLLSSTSLNVADVSARVGYGSVGSFTRRFTESVGLSPTQFRKLPPGAGGEVRDAAPSDVPVPVPGGVPLGVPVCVPVSAGRGSGSMTGVVRTPGVVLSPVFVGVFDSPILQGAPVSWSSGPVSECFSLSRIPAGTWYVHAVAHGRHPGHPGHPEGGGDADFGLLMGTAGPVRVEGGAGHCLDITLSPPDWTRPPILFALMDIAPQPVAV